MNLIDEYEDNLDDLACEAIEHRTLTDALCVAFGWLIEKKEPEDEARTEPA